jgi:Outer membrane protein beta-barrel domain
MRQAFLVGLAIFISVQSLTAQTTVTIIEPPFETTPIKFAIIGSLNSSTAHVSYPSTDISVNHHTGFGIGASLEAQFEGNLYFTPYAMINNRGYGYTAVSALPGGSHPVTKDQVSMYFLDIVPALSYDLGFTKWEPSGKFVFSFGPQLGFGFHGTEKKTVGTHATVTSTMHFSTSTDYSLVDLGVALSVGYHNKKGFVQLAYQLGVANIDDNAPTDHGNIQNRSISLGLGYYLK